MARATYEIAETDELEALGRDDNPIDTSAGLDPDDPVQHTQYDDDSEPSGKRKWCFCLIVVVLTLAATAAILGIVFSLRNKGQQDNNTQSAPNTDLSSGSPTDAGDQNPSGSADDSGNLQPITPPQSKPSPVAVPQPQSPSASAKTFAINVIESLPHDTGAFTQGFEYAYGFFYESTGLRGQSSLRKVEMDTGKVLQKYDLQDMTLFGEGMTLHTTHHIFMLTWQSQRGFIFNQTTFEVIREWKYEGEGWGLATDPVNDVVYMSDGSSQLRILDADDLSEKSRIDVTLNGKAVANLNELEWVCGEIWSNVWMTSKIFRIDPTTGVVKSVIDASILPLKGDREPSSDVLNGIAFDKGTGRLWFTGKKWKKIYQVSITDDSLDLTKCK